MVLSRCSWRRERLEEGEEHRYLRSRPSNLTVLALKSAHNLASISQYKRLVAQKCMISGASIWGHGKYSSNIDSIDVLVLLTLNLVMLA